MKTAAYNLEEKQIGYVEDEAKARATSASATMRLILSSLMETKTQGKRVVAYHGLDGILHLDPEFAKTGDSPVSCEQVSTEQG